MAVFSLTASSSSFVFSSSSSAKPPTSSSSSRAENKTPFVGFSVPQAPKLWIPTTSSLTFNNESISRRSFEVHSTQEITGVPLDERRMWQDDEVDGIDIWNKTWYPKAADHVNTDKPWYIVDATHKILGRLASTIAIYIRGKNLAT